MINVIDVEKVWLGMNIGLQQIGLKNKDFISIVIQRENIWEQDLN